jgi:hypothetical protein
LGFEPLFKGTKLIGHSDLNGRGDCLQLQKWGKYLYVSHMWSTGFSVVDVSDPTSPEVVAYVPSASPNEWNIKNRVIDNTLLVSSEWAFFQPNSDYWEYRKKGLNPEDASSKTPHKKGLNIYDVSDPKNPKLLSFFPTGGNYGVHRFWFDGNYAYLSTSMDGYFSNIFMIVDVTDRKAPKEISRWWYPGQWIAGGERPPWPKDYRPRHHHPIVSGDRAYAGWFDAGLVILDISSLKRPTFVSGLNMRPPYGGKTHTCLPIKDRNYLVVTEEATFEPLDKEKYIWIIDIREEKKPLPVARFPVPDRRLIERGIRFGPHNIHENVPGSMVDEERIYATYCSAGLRIYDISDVYRPKEIGYYVPGTPKIVNDPLHGPIVDVNDVFVDEKGLIYLSNYNGGIDILEFKD